MPSLRKNDYIYALFFGHLFLEKLFKALVVMRTKRQAPPVHNLRLLIEESNIVLSEKQTELIIRVNDYNIRARYPDFKFKFKKLCTKKFTLEELKQIEEFGKWLKKQI